ncbi:General transcription factor 3C polypeptide 2 [Amphibalanus amphitrite]|uniref:General transcription factor 3C polypeptide 2 n=1 Tax=Amphibalanus amphitrite TaxID=1232801 RepID=A0A6A4W2J0_AMPAM|nr:General transcription factor 3C polypeptide 2 [Amphibalanus amphitrite]
MSLGRRRFYVVRPKAIYRRPVMPKKSAKSAASAAPSSGGAKPAPQSEDCRRGAGSRRKQRMPLRVTSDSEEPDVDTAGETPPTSKQELPSELTEAAASATVTSSATTSLIAALNTKRSRPPKAKDVARVQCGVCKEWHEQEEKNKGEEDCEPPKKRKRQSAAKLSKSNDPDYEPDEVVTARSSTRGPVKRGFSAPRLAPHPNTVAKWERALQTERQLTCQMPGCQFQADSADDMVTHYPNCPGLPAKWKLFTCDHCGEQADTETDIVKHVEQSHRSAAPETAGPRGKPNMRRTGAIVPDMAGELTYFTAVERQSCPREQTEKYWSQLPKSRVLSATARKIDGWRPAGQESRRYMPPMKLSPAYKVQEIGDPDPHRTFERLDPFAFEELDNGVLCFSGGPVVACDWCPLPADWSGDADETQFLAVACLPVVDAHLPPVEPSTLPTAVQVWSFSGDRRTARLEFALCVDGGPVWDLAWCPIGERTVPPADRLGCLALACGDGRVRVYTVPAPATLDAGSAGAPVFYRKEPDMRLEVFGDMGRSPCLRLAWAATEGNRSISAILGNGVVVFWNLQASSPLLCQTEGASQVLYPVQVIAAHRGHGTALAFSPASDRHLATGGRDRTLQMWDREEPASLQRAATKLRPMLTDLCWPIATKKLLNAYDHSLFVGSPSMMLSDVAMPVQDAPLFTHGAKCTSVSVNTTCERAGVRL